MEYKEKQFLIRRSHIPVLRDFLTANFVIGDFVGTEYFQTFPFHVHLPPYQAQQHLNGKKLRGYFSEVSGTDRKKQQQNANAVILYADAGLL